MKEIRHGIIGSASATFGGGKIVVGVGADTESNVGVLMLAEAKEKHSIGDNADEISAFEPQMEMAFTNIRSIEVVRRALDKIEVMFKDGVIKEHEEEQKVEGKISADGESSLGMFCPQCGEKMICDKTKVCTSEPPQYEYKCPKCGHIGYDTRNDL